MRDEAVIRLKWWRLTASSIGEAKSKRASSGEWRRGKR
jgi:hypothetical protein